jgi:S-adenosylmethionine:tRNA ribosyltransferase-isomerase
VISAVAAPENKIATTVPWFELSPDREAHEPPEARGLARDEVRLLVSRRGSRALEHATFRDLPDYVRPGDVLVVNLSATLPAALRARTDDGVEIGFHLSTHLAGNLWIVEPRDFARIGEPAQPPIRMQLPGDAYAVLLDRHADSSRLWIAALHLAEPIETYLRDHGKPIAYAYQRGEWPIPTYQTVYARVPGSAEMPSAGRPFSTRVLDRLRGAGVDVAEIVLHTGVASPERDEAPYEEWFSVPLDAAAKVNAAKRFGRRVIAVGTTSVRALESASDVAGHVSATNGWTDLLVTPQRGVRVVDSLLTGLHEPKSTHLAMLEAIAGRDHIENAYRSALERGYLWHEFGDSHLIL